jgi:hypothetical protein
MAGLDVGGDDSGGILSTRAVEAERDEPARWEATTPKGLLGPLLGIEGGIGAGKDAVREPAFGLARITLLDELLGRRSRLFLMLPLGGGR